ncbi:DUF7558 family protein [Natronorubrum thiooxidans]|uniref:DUF7558 family protein n=1 Tax=Natronorubrum thiooxidans TaxID=308853 RepID=UPI00097167D3|nr:hypothetical protein [Natronorubrum thiooxidans]
MQTLKAPDALESGEAHTWGQDERVTHPICIDCATQETPGPNKRDHHACDGCGLVVDALAALTRFRVEVGHLEGSLQLCADCSPGGPTTYWTRDHKEHVVAVE